MAGASSTAQQNWPKSRLPLPMKSNALPSAPPSRLSDLEADTDQCAVHIMLKLQALMREHSSVSPLSSAPSKGESLPMPRQRGHRGRRVVEHACSISTLQMGSSPRTLPVIVDTTPCASLLACASITFNFPAVIRWMLPLAMPAVTPLYSSRPSKTHCRPCCWWSWR